MALKKSEKPEQPKKNISQEVPKPQERGLGGLRIKMGCKRGNNENEWNFKAKSPPDAVDEGKRICKDNGFRFPQDVVVWDFS